jgi:radical SAM superfamily enzyme
MIMFVIRTRKMNENWNRRKLDRLQKDRYVESKQVSLVDIANLITVIRKEISVHRGDCENR